MKIAFLCTTFLPDVVGGGETYCFNLARALQSMGHEVMVVRMGQMAGCPDAERTFVYEGIRVITAPMSLRDRSRWAEAEDLRHWAREWLRRERPAIVHVMLFSGMISIVKEAHEQGIPIVLTALEFGLSCARVTLVSTGHSLCDGKMEHGKCERCLLSFYSAKHRLIYSWIRWLPMSWMRFLDGLTRRLSSKVPLLATRVKRDLHDLEESMRSFLPILDRVIAPCRFMKTVLLMNSVPQEKVIHSVYGYSRSVSARPMARVPSKMIRFGYLGRLHPLKGIDVLIRAFRQLPHPGISLSLYGPLPSGLSPEDEVSGWLGMARSDARIRFGGEVSRDGIQGVFENLDVLVVPSTWYENSPLVILESLSHQTPVICTHLEGMTELIRHGVNGLTFPRGDADALSQQMRRFIEEPGLLQQLRDGIQSPKSIEENAGEMEGLYNGLLHKG